VDTKSIRELIQIMGSKRERIGDVDILKMKQSLDVETVRPNMKSEIMELVRFNP
jgi:hypothetical protein